MLIHAPSSRALSPSFRGSKVVVALDRLGGPGGREATSLAEFGLRRKFLFLVFGDQPGQRFAVSQAAESKDADRGERKGPREPRDRLADGRLRVRPACLELDSERFRGTAILHGIG